MSAIKHYDPVLKTWVTDGAANAENIKLNNPAFNTGTTPVSVNDGFNKVDSRVTTLEHNLAWVYLNGAKGGGSGGDTVIYTLNCAQSNQTVFTSNGIVTLDGITVTGGNSSKPFTLTISDSKSNAVLSTIVLQSKKPGISTTVNVSQSTSLMLQAIDTSGNATDPIFITVNVVTLQLGVLSKNLYIYSDKDVSCISTYKVVSNTESCNLHVTLDGTEIVNQQIVGTQSNYQYSINFRPYFQSLVISSVHNVKVWLSSNVNGTDILSTESTYTITVVDSTNLIIVLNNISTDITNRTQIPINNTLSFQYLLNYYPSGSTTFSVYYELYKGSTLIKTFTTSTSQLKNTSYIISISTGEYTEGDYSVKLYATSNQESNITSTTTAYISLITASSIFMPPVHNGNLLMHFANQTMAESNSTLWEYDNTGTYVASLNSNFTTQLQVYNTISNDTLKTGFQSVGKTRAIVFDASAYGTINQFSNLFFSQDNSLSLKGFDFSLTFKTDADAEDSDTVFAIKQYNANNILYNGLVIRAGQVELTIQGSTVTSPLSKGNIITIDLNTKLEETIIDDTTYSYYYYIIYVNGIMTRAQRTLAYTQTGQESISVNSGFPWQFNTVAYLGVDYDYNNNLSNYCVCDVFDIKLYQGELTDWQIVKNYVQSIECSSLTSSGDIDLSLKNTLYQKNLIDLSSNDCYIVDSNGVYLQGQALLTALLANRINVPYRILVAEETSSSSTDFYKYAKNIYSFSSETEKNQILSESFPCQYQYYDLNSTTPILIQQGSGDTTPSITIQGTSSLSNNSKNFESSYGTTPNVKFPSGYAHKLFQPIDDWLPENEHTIKADVVDSGHVNNVVIGKFINGELGGPALMGNTPPMSLSDSDYASTIVKNYVTARLKQTSDGFPILLFIKFKDTTGDIMEFQGVYNFNLGRYAYFNLGLRKMYDIDTTGSTPRVLTDYVEKEWDECYSYECSTNDNQYLNFTQDHLSIAQQMFGSPKYFYNKNSSDSTTYPAALFNNDPANYGFMQEMARAVPQSEATCAQYQYVESGGVGTYQALNKSYTYNNTIYTFDNLTKYLDYENFCKALLTIIIFGMLDSSLKNLTLRYWKSLSATNKWWSAFYDMDTAFGGNNVGEDNVAYFAHLHYFYNAYQNGKLGTAIMRFFSGQDTNGNQLYDHGTDVNNVPGGQALNQFYACYTNRLWKILDDAIGIYAVDTSGNSTYQTIANYYTWVRENLINDPEKFITDNVQSYVEQTGAILYNYDYQIKYINIANQIGIKQTDSQAASDQSGFLHGTRVQFIKDWFVKRIYFLDCVYNYNSTSVTSIINTQWLNNKVKSSSGQASFTIASPSKVLFKAYGEDENKQQFWINSTEVSTTLSIPTGEKTFTIIPSSYISELYGLQYITWTNLATLNFPKLKVININDQSSIPSSGFLSNVGLYKASTNIGLKNIEEVYFKNIVFSDNAIIPLEASECNKLRIIDISNSSFSGVNCGPTVESLNLFGTPITTINYSNLPSLKTLVLGNNPNLTSIVLNNCPKLESLIIPPTVTSLTIINCKSLKQLDLSFQGTKTSQLATVSIADCPSLITISLNRQNNLNGVMDLRGATNLQNLDLSNTLNIQVKLSDTCTSLVSVNFAQCGSSLFIGNTQIISVLDLSKHKNLQKINLFSCSSITKLITDSNVELINQACSGCSSLQTIEGKYTITGTAVFQGCSSLDIDPTQTTLIFNVSSIERLFSGCAQLSNTAFTYIIQQLNVKDSNDLYINKINNANYAFQGCNKITLSIYDTFFAGSFQYISNMKSMFADSSIGGNITKQLFTPMLQLTNIESAFSGTKIVKIYNNVFDNLYEQIKYVNSAFAACPLLHGYTIVNGQDVEGLQADTFFANFSNLADTILPQLMFSGCSNVIMYFNTYLFHSCNTTISTSLYKITSDIYSGVTLKGNITNQLYQGTSVVINGKTYYQSQVLQSIISPFIECVGSDIKMDMINTQGIFHGLPTLQILQEPFNGCYATTTAITNEIFNTNNNTNNNLTSIQGFYKGIQNFTYDGQFPVVDQFKYTVNLQNISNLFQDCTLTNIQLVGDRFTTCKLIDVSSAFYNSGVYGMIPFHLFYMTNPTISKMNNIFYGCYKLGYTKDRTLNIGTIYNNGVSITTWNEHVISNKGTKVWYEIDNTQYSGDEKIWAIDGYTINSSSSYTADDDTQAATYNGTYVTGYNQIGFQHYAFPSDLFRYCSADCTLEQALSGLTYKINILQIPDGASSNDAILVSGSTTITETIRGTSTTYSVSSDYDGLVGRIPAKLFDSLINNTKFIKVFSDTHFSPYINMDVNATESGLSYVLGWKYPFGLFDKNINLTSISGIFKGTEIEIGVQIDTNLFEKCTKLTDISEVWSNVRFHNEKDLITPIGTTSSGGTVLDRTGMYPFVNRLGTSGVDIPFTACASYLQTISNLFAIDNMTNPEQLGLWYFVNTGLLWFNNYTHNNVAINYSAISNISGVFRNNNKIISMTSPYTTINTTQITQYNNYLPSAINKSQVTNANSIAIELQPASWNN